MIRLYGSALSLLLAGSFFFSPFAGRVAGYVKYTQLSASAKKKCRRLSGNKAKLKKGNVVKVKKATTAWNGSIWIQIKSGWLPVVVKGKYRVKAV